MKRVLLALLLCVQSYAANDDVTEEMAVIAGGAGFAALGAGEMGIARQKGVGIFDLKERLASNEHFLDDRINRKYMGLLNQVKTLDDEIRNLAVKVGDPELTYAYDDIRRSIKALEKQRLALVKQVVTMELTQPGYKHVIPYQNYLSGRPYEIRRDYRMGRSMLKFGITSAFIGAALATATAVNLNDNTVPLSELPTSFDAEDGNK